MENDICRFVSKLSTMLSKMKAAIIGEIRAQIGTVSEVFEFLEKNFRKKNESKIFKHYINIPICSLDIKKLYYS